MLRSSILAFVAVGLLVTEASAVIKLYLDEIDDARIINAVADADKVRDSHQEIQELEKHLLKLDRVALTAVLAKSAEMPAKTYAMPVSETRGLALSGLSLADDNRPDSDFVSFHPVGDFAAVEAYYSLNKRMPFAVRGYFENAQSCPARKVGAVGTGCRWVKRWFPFLVRRGGGRILLLLLACRFVGRTTPAGPWSTVTRSSEVGSQTEEDGLPGVVRQQSHHDPPTACHNLRWNPQEVIHERAKLQTQKSLFLRRLRLLLGGLVPLPRRFPGW